VGGEFEVLFGVLVVPTMFSLCSQQVPNYAPNVFPKFPMCFLPHATGLQPFFRNRNYLHVRGGGSLRFYLGFGGSHCVLIVFPKSSQLCSQCIPQVPNVFPTGSQCIPDRFPMWSPLPPPQKKLSLNLVQPLGGATIHESLRHVELTSGIPFEGIRGWYEPFYFKRKLMHSKCGMCKLFFVRVVFVFFFFSQMSSEVMKWPDYLYSRARTDLSSWSGSFFGMAEWSVWLMRLTPKNNFFTKFVCFMFFSSTVYPGYYRELSPMGGCYVVISAIHPFPLFLLEKWERRRKQTLMPRPTIVFAIFVSCFWLVLIAWLQLQSLSIGLF